MPDLSRTSVRANEPCESQCESCEPGCEPCESQKKVSSKRYLLKFLLVFLNLFWLSIDQKTKRLLRIIEGLKKSGAIENRDSTVIFLKLLGNCEQAVNSGNNNKNTKNKKRTSLSPPRSKDYKEFVNLMVLWNLYSTDVIWTLIMPMERVSFCCQHASRDHLMISCTHELNHWEKSFFHVFRSIAQEKASWVSIHQPNQFNSRLTLHIYIYLPPQGFGPEAKTRGGTLGVPACIHLRNFKI